MQDRSSGSDRRGSTTTTAITAVQSIAGGLGLALALLLLLPFLAAFSLAVAVLDPEDVSDLRR